MKIGRNDKCPCGGGLKYKKCCMTEQSMPSFDEFSKLVSDHIRESEKVDYTELSQYNRVDMISTIAYLQCLSENHGKNIRLEEILRNVLIINSESENKVDLCSIKDFVVSKFQHNHLEDPPEDLFTRNISTPVGNFTVFAGIGDGTIFILQQLLNAIFIGKFDNETKKRCLSSSMALLCLSDIITKILGYERNTKGIDTPDNNIFFPKEVHPTIINDCFVYDDKRLKTVLERYELTIEDIGTLIFTPECEELKNNDRNQFPFLIKPIVKIDDLYIILSPPNLVGAAVVDILRNAYHLGIYEKIIHEYTLACRDYTGFLLQNMGYYGLSISVPTTKLNLRERIFRFDTDKIAYVCIIFDDGKNFNFENPYSESVKLCDSIEYKARILQVQNILKENFSDDIVFNLFLVLGISRPSAASIPINTCSDQLAISLHDLETLSLSKKCNNLTLWNYSQAQRTVDLVHFNQIDNIAFFIENDESFYHSDKENSSAIYIGIGNSIEFKYQTVIKNDVKVCLLPQNQWITTLRVDLPDLLPIYSTEELVHLGCPFCTCTDIFGSYLWINPINKKVQATDKYRFECEIVPHAIAYWLVRLAHLLKEQSFVLESPFEIAIGVDYNIDDIDINDFIGIDSISNDGIEINYSNERLIIRLSINFINMLDSPDNIAEIKLMSKIIKSLKITSDSIVENIINEVMPVSTCKRIVFKMSDFDCRTSAKNKIDNIKQSRYYINKLADGLAESMSVDKPYVSKELPDDVKNKFSFQVVEHYYMRLRNILSKYDSIYALKTLYAFYESSIQQREAYKMMLIPEISCFNSDSVIAKKRSDDIKNTDISVSLRCLIEHIAAERTYGTKKITKSIIDECAAYMHHIIDWGFIGDAIKFNIYDIKLSLLESKRVGINRKSMDASLVPYFNAKQIEKTNELLRSFGQYLARPKVNLIEHEEDIPFETAFKDEFGVAFQDFIDISTYLNEKAFNCKHSILCESIEAICSEISSQIKIEYDTVKCFIDNFSLKERGKVENTKNASDFMPWRYNRKLSLLRRPLIVYVENEVEYVMVGARTIVDSQLYIASSIFDTKFQADNKKMKSFISGMNHQKGTDFTNEMFDLLSNQFNPSAVILDKEVEISPNGKLKNDIDLGDIDIFVIDTFLKKIVAIECKNINEPRTPYEMHSEYMKFITGNDPWIPKVDKRNCWLKNNMDKLSIYDIIEIEKYSFEYIFLTNDIIALPFLKTNEIKYRFISKKDLLDDANILFENSNL